MEKKLLNEIPTLDKGYVAIHSCAPSGKELAPLCKEFYKSKYHRDIEHLVQVVFKIKCPLFVQLNFTSFNLRTVTSKDVVAIDAFVPTIVEINAQNLEASTAIQEDIERTTHALLLNPKAYQSEHCDRFVSQIITPISVFNTLLISGSLAEWTRFIKQTGLPKPIEVYRKAIVEALFAEFPDWTNL